MGAGKVNQDILLWKLSGFRVWYRGLLYCFGLWCEGKWSFIGQIGRSFSARHCQASIQLVIWGSRDQSFHLLFLVTSINIAYHYYSH